MNHILHKLAIVASAAMIIHLSACEFLDEVCESEAPSVKVGQIYVDTYEASRVNATAQTQGVGISLACNYANTLPWNNVSYEDARNACLDAGKRLCTKDEWMSACGTAFPYGTGYKSGSCNDGGTIMATGSKSSCKSSSGTFDMSGNLYEWVEGGYLMGGSYNSEKEELSCTSAKQISDPVSYTPTPSIGFRCCKDASTLF